MVSYDARPQRRIVRQRWAHKKLLNCQKILVIVPKWEDNLQAIFNIFYNLVQGRDNDKRFVIIVWML